MFKVLYSFFTSATYVFLKFWPFSSLKTKKWIIGQTSVFDEILHHKASFINGCVWFHVASVGEFEQAKPLLSAFKKQFPDETILLTFFSPSGYCLKKKIKEADIVTYLPFDTKKRVKRFLQLVNPKLALFCKYDFWYNYLAALFQHKIPTLLFSATFTEKHFMFKWFGKPHRKLLAEFTHLFVQDETSKLLLNEYGITSSVAGDTRIDSIITASKNIRHHEKIKHFKGQSRLFIAGSTWNADIKLILELFNELLQPKKIKLIIAPHEIDDETINNLLTLIPLTQTYSTYTTDYDNINVLIIDSIGMLKKLYAYAEYAYIGGGFGKGIHNILEPAIFGIPIIFGPDYNRFVEAKEMVRQKSAFTIKNSDELIDIVEKLCNNNQLYTKTGNLNKQYLMTNSGATKKIMKTIVEMDLLC